MIGIEKKEPVFFIQKALFIFVLAFLIMIYGCDKGSSTSSGSAATTNTNTSTVSVSNLAIELQNFYSNEPAPKIKVSKIPSEAKVMLYEGSCDSSPLATLSRDGVFSDITEGSPNSERFFFVGLNYRGITDCQPLPMSYVYLQAPHTSVDELNTDKRYPSFKVDGLFNAEGVTVGIYFDEECSSKRASDEVDVTSTSARVQLYTRLSDLSEHSYYVKQSYRGVSTCSETVAYSYELAVSSLSLAYDEVLFGSSPSGISVRNIINGGRVSLHKDSCLTEPNATINKDSQIYPLPELVYSEHNLYLKYTFMDLSDCVKLDATYINLEPATLSLNAVETEKDKRVPVFDVASLFGRTVVLTLHEDSSCSTPSVSDPLSISILTGSIRPNSQLADLSTHTYFVKQTYRGAYSCSLGVSYSYDLSISSLKITKESILYGNNPTSVRAQKLISGSSLSLHRGDCNSDSDSVIETDGDLTVQVSGEYEDSQIYLKYSFSDTSDCQSIGSRFIYIQPPTLAIDSVSTATNRAHPVFNISNLFPDHTVAVSMYENSECGGVPLSDVEESSTGEFNGIELIEDLFSDETHTYYVKQTYQGVSSCSQGLVYKYDYDFSCNNRISTSGSISYMCSSLEYNKDRLYSSNRNKGVVISGTEFAGYIKVYKGINCTREENLVGGGYTKDRVSLIETPYLDEGGKYLSFLQLDPNGDTVGCFTLQEPVVLKYPRYYAAAGSKILLGVDSSRRVVSFSNIDPAPDPVLLPSKLINAYATYSTTSLGAWALLLENGSVQTLGNAPGSDSSSVRSLLTNQENRVLSIYSNGGAFVALREDGSLVTWGDSDFGGDSSSVASDINGSVPVVEVVSTFNAFCALRSDGSVVSWGSSKNGADQGVVSSYLDGAEPVRVLYSAFSYGEEISDSTYGGEFFALRSDGSTVYWGGSNNAAVAEFYDTRAIKDIFTATKRSWQNFIIEYVFLYQDGSVSEPVDTNESIESVYSLVATPVVTNARTGIETLLPNSETAWLVRRSNGSVGAWGASEYGGDLSSVSSTLLAGPGIQKVYSTDYAFSVLRADGSVVSWGSSEYGGNQGGVSAGLNGQTPVVSMYSNSRAFVALRSDGSLVCWGEAKYGGDCSLVNTFHPVKRVYSSGSSFVALTEDGKLIGWGGGGVEPREITQEDQPAVVELYQSNIGGYFIAVLADGTSFSWNNSVY